MLIGVMMVGNISPAYATSHIYIDNTGSGSSHYISGYANTTALYARDDGSASPSTYTKAFTDWVQSPLDDTLTMSGGELRTYGLYQNGTIQATGGNITVNSGSLHIGSSSYINSGANLSLASGATLAITGGSVSLNSGDSINSGVISATSGSLSFTGGTHTISSGSNIANSFSVTGGTVSFASANSLNSNFSNSANVAFNGGTLDNNVSGTGNTTFNNTVTNTGSVTQSTVTNTGSLTNNGTVTADLSNTNAIAGTGSIVTGTGTSSNNGTMTQSSLTNNGTFTSNGKITLTNGLTNNNATFNNNAMLLALVNNTLGSTFNSDPDNLGEDVANNGTLNLNADGTLSVAVTGTGTTNINGDLTNANSISQKDITVASGKVVTTNASNMTATNAITNDGIINYTAGTTANTINGTGRIDITGYVTNNGNITQNKVSNSGIFTNNGTVTADITNTNAIEGTGSITTGTGVSSNSGTIEQAALTNNGTFDNNGHITLTGALTNNSTFNTNADLITAAGGVANAGNFNIIGGTNASTITGAGTTNFSNTVTNNGAITQTTVTNSGNLTNNALITADVTNTGTLTSKGGDISGNIANTGSFVVTNGNNSNAITGTGTTSILGTTTNNGTIAQDKVIVGNAGAFTTASDTVTAAIENEGALTWNGGSTNNNAISGSGDLTVAAGADVLNLSTINQNSITVNTSGALTSDASMLTSANGLINYGDLAFLSGTNNNEIFGTGDLSILGLVTNNALIEQNTIDVSLGKLTTNAGLLAATGGIVNDSELSFTGGDNNNAITGSGMTYIDGTVQNLANISTKIQVNTGAHYGTATDVQAKIDNRGTTDLIDADIASSGKISGTGTTNILGDTVNNGTITQSAVTIASNGSLTTNSQDVNSAVTNDGTLIWNAGGANANVIDGTGALQITGGTIANTAAISQNQINITGGSLTSNADLLASVGGINNAATLGITGGTNNNVITGTGTTNFSNTVINTASITQAAVTNTGSFTNNDATITAAITNSGDFINNNGFITGTVTNTGNLVSKGEDIDGDIVNNGTYDIVDGENDNDITGTGDVLILGNTRNTGTINQDTITIDTGATFVASDMSDVVTASGIANAGTFEMQTGTNANAITGNTGTLNVTGIVTNTSGVSITQDTINIATLGNFTADAGDLNTVNGITNTGALTLGDGTNNNAISGTGALTIAGVVNNLGNISQDLLTNNGTLTSDASLLAFANGITNSNTLALTGGTNNNVISGTGTTDLTGDVVNYAAITQTTVTNAGTLDNYDTITGAIINTGTIDSIADDLNGTVNNSGTLNLEGGNTLGAITGTGVTNITDDLVNAFTIAQTTVNNSADLTNNAAITANFNNSGTVANNAAITGAISNTGTIDSTADNLNGAVTNDGTLIVAGGTTQNTISGNGNTNITGDLVANHTINQASVTNDAALTNNTVITATNINNNGTITGAAANLVGSIANEGTLVFNAASTGASNIAGAGNVQVTADTTLTGSNSFTGGALIDGSTLTVAGASNLGTGDVTFANNGVLEVTAAGSLGNVLKGQAATDDITVDNAAALTLNTATGAANDFHKTGSGVMTLAMGSNGYTGDTYVDGGTLIGNTSNINNMVHVSAGGTVEFNDTTDAELNAISAAAGAFVQSGSAVLNVESNAFTANQVDINAGTFAANSALTATTLNVNGGTLRGKGNITGTVNVNAGGTIAPGNSIDTLTITGDLNLASGSTTAIEINDTPASDKLVVTGATNIASGANLTVSNESGRYFEWDSFDILESAGNVTGTFTYDGTVSNYDASRINVEMDYSDPTKVALTVKRKATDYAGTTAGLPRNASESAHAIDAVSTGFGGDITNALLQLEKLGGLNPDGVTLINPNATLLSALNDLHGVLYANTALTPLFNAKTAHVYDRIAKRQPSTGKCPHCHDNVWAEYYSQYDKVYSDENSPRFKNNMTGVLVGYDRSSDEALLGVYGGFGKSDLRQSDDRMDIEDASLGIYGGYMTGDWLFKGTLYGGMQNYHGRRYISFMGRETEGKYNGVSLGLDLEASYTIPVDSWLNVKPFVGWLNNYSHQQAFAETGADSLNLHVSGNDQFNSQARLGFELNGKIKNKFSWYGSAAVKQFVGDDYAKVRMDLGLPNTRMEIISAELGRTSFSGQVGANYAFTNNWSIFANLEAGVSNKSTNCYGNAGVAYTW